MKTELVKTGINFSAIEANVPSLEVPMEVSVTAPKYVPLLIDVVPAPLCFTSVIFLVLILWAWFLSRLFGDVIFFKFVRSLFSKA